MGFYHDGMRELQDRYEGRAVADRLEQHLMRSSFTEEDKAFIESCPFFFLATATAGHTDCSFKGGEPGFVRVVGKSELAWPDYDGNRMYRSLGNIRENPKVGLLFLRFDGRAHGLPAARLRVNGSARIDEDSDAIAGLRGAKRLVVVRAEHIYPNCPRYIPQMQFVDISVYAPREGHIPPEPTWKSRPFVNDIFDKEKG